MTERQLKLPEPPPPDETKTLKTLEALRRIGLSEKTLAFMAKKNALPWEPTSNRSMQQVNA